jgi:hypothetical protein
LDAVLELIDGDGNVLARSDNSPAEAEGRQSIFTSGSTKAYVLQKSAPYNGEDFYTTNPRDPGMRIVLPGALGTTNTYHVRLRSSSPNLDDLGGGLTSGAYQLQLRLQEIDEVAGSMVRFGDIAFATNGIEVLGLPTHSPLGGEYAEPDEASLPNDTIAQSLQLGNLLTTDRGALSIAGLIDDPMDVDWYTFEVT